ncbi:hypothetical protein Pan216_53520 [Planctomycetes bacterium Pan216]|uniref:Transcobalamin-like C-terminal domain-containing protein n=1 Tax=Kolteria novifilia TaxID=2527975 RepID=A0A518BBW4_9BACT|nr:hypothetical protein Pan216_53520 [Planctomycetes bacterium Pan216]
MNQNLACTKLLALLAALHLVGCQQRNDPSLSAKGDSDADKPTMVEITYVFPDGPRSYTLNFVDGMTVLEGMEKVATLQDGVKFQRKGEGPATLITSIGGIANEGDTDGAKDWICLLNGRRIEGSAATHQFKPLDKIVWKFIDPDELESTTPGPSDDTSQ